MKITSGHKYVHLVVTFLTQKFSSVKPKLLLKGMSVQQKKEIEEDWVKEQARLKIKFEEAKKVVQAIEKREVMGSSKGQETEDDLIANLKKQAEERRAMMHERKEKAIKEAKRDEELKEKFIGFMERFEKDYDKLEKLTDAVLGFISQSNSK